MNSVKENADIQSVTADTHPEKSPELEKRRFRDSSMDRDEDDGHNDDNNNVDLKLDRGQSRPASGRSAMAKDLSPVDFRRRGSPHRSTSTTNHRNDPDEDREEIYNRNALSEDAKMSPLRIAIGEEEAENDHHVGKSNIDSLSKTLHINDEIINIIANSKNLIVNGENVPKEVAAKNERVSFPLNIFSLIVAI